ncbi:Hypothetical predicted protein [Octopus vulgaris]|uniref:Uncharacterized protein n=1 Tax=Octopus vulgaris TaxID=6645 RepID=A0AA36AYZ5_OCTVU|nr:Hypothetical predicted protein [Octopus vulgaris]
MTEELKEENENEAEIIDQEGDKGTEEQISILNEIIDIWTSGEQSFDTGFKKVDRKKLNEWVRKINDIIVDIRTGNITDTNNLINAISIFVVRKLGLKAKEKYHYENTKGYSFSSKWSIITKQETYQILKPYRHSSRL